jgi:hypothetical protein
MSYKLIDLYTEKVLGTYETTEAANKAQSHLVNEPGETRYAIEAPVVQKPKAKKARVKKQSE